MIGQYDTALGPRWYAEHDCGWLESGFVARRWALQQLERHIAFICFAPTCHHP